MLKGSLKRPVNVRILEDDEPRWGRVLLGKRTPDDPHSKFVVEDDDEEYRVEWAQCVNEFAPKRVDYNDPNAQRGSGYQCGDAEKYGESKLVVVEGDPSSRVIEWMPPPKPECWTSMDISLGVKPEPPASASAAVETPPPDAGAGGTTGDPAGSASAKVPDPPPKDSAVDSKVPPDAKTTPPPAPTSEAKPREDRRQLGKDKDPPPPPAP